MDKNRSMVDVAYELMSKKKKAVNFYKLWQEVSEVKGFDEEEKDEKESLFYTNITLDGRFITIGENNWDLRSRHKFDEVHIDMNDIYTDEDEESEEVEDDVDEYILNELEKVRNKSNISFFGFTATPKNKTLELFTSEDENGEHHVR